MRFAGLGAAAVLAVCLGSVAVAMTGGPQAPFTQWAVPQVPASPSGGHNSQAAGHSPGSRSGSAGAQDPVAAGATGAAGAGTTPSQTASPAPSAGSSPSATATSGTARQSPAPTNPAGKTPPGHIKSAHPHASASAT